MTAPSGMRGARAQGAASAAPLNLIHRSKVPNPATARVSRRLALALRDLISAYEAQLAHEAKTGPAPLYFVKDEDAYHLHEDVNEAFLSLSLATPSVEDRECLRLFCFAEAMKRRADATRSE